MSAGADRHLLGGCSMPISLEDEVNPSNRESGPLILITGPPGSGKTTALKAVADSLPTGSFAGFYTEEIRIAGVRTGFMAITFSGRSGVLAHVEIKKGPRVGKYGVDLDAFEKLAVKEIDPRTNDSSLFLVDEIGKMECFSQYFVDCIRRILAERRHLVATVAQRGSGLISEIKQDPRAVVYELNRSNRDELPHRVVEALAD